MGLDDRVKTDVRFSERVFRYMDEQSRSLGIPKNAYVTMAVCRQIADLAKFVRGKKKRQTLLNDVENLFQKVLEEARGA